MEIDAVTSSSNYTHLLICCTVIQSCHLSAALCNKELLSLYFCNTSFFYVMLANLVHIMLAYIYVSLLVLKCNLVNPSAAFGFVLSSVTTAVHDRHCLDHLQDINVKGNSYTYMYNRSEVWMCPRNRYGKLREWVLRPRAMKILYIYAWFQKCFGNGLEPFIGVLTAVGLELLLWK